MSSSSSSSPALSASGAPDPPNVPTFEDSRITDRIMDRRIEARGLAGTFASNISRRKSPNKTVPGSVRAMVNRFEKSDENTAEASSPAQQRLDFNSMSAPGAASTTSKENTDPAQPVEARRITNQRPFTPGSSIGDRIPTIETPNYVVEQSPFRVRPMYTPRSLINPICDEFLGEKNSLTFLRYQAYFTNDRPLGRCLDEKEAEEERQRQEQMDKEKKMSTRKGKEIAKDTPENPASDTSDTVMENPELYLATRGDRRTMTLSMIQSSSTAPERLAQLMMDLQHFDEEEPETETGARSVSTSTNNVRGQLWVGDDEIYNGAPSPKGVHPNNPHVKPEDVIKDQPCGSNDTDQVENEHTDEATSILIASPPLPRAVSPPPIPARHPHRRFALRPGTPMPSFSQATPPGYHSSPPECQPLPDHRAPPPGYYTPLERIRHYHLATGAPRAANNVDMSSPLVVHGSTTPSLFSPEPTRAANNLETPSRQSVLTSTSQLDTVSLASSPTLVASESLFLTQTFSDSSSSDSSSNYEATLEGSEYTDSDEDIWGVSPRAIPLIIPANLLRPSPPVYHQPTRPHNRFQVSNLFSFAPRILNRQPQNPNPLGMRIVSPQELEERRAQRYIRAPPPLTARNLNRQNTGDVLPPLRSNGRSPQDEANLPHGNVPLHRSPRVQFPLHQNESRHIGLAEAELSSEGRHLEYLQHNGVSAPCYTGHSPSPQNYPLLSSGQTERSRQQPVTPEEQLSPTQQSTSSFLSSQIGQQRPATVSPQVRSQRTRFSRRRFFRPQQRAATASPRNRPAPPQPRHINSSPLDRPLPPLPISVRRGARAPFLRFGMDPIENREGASRAQNGEHSEQPQQPMRLPIYEEFAARRLQFDVSRRPAHPQQQERRKQHATPHSERPAYEQSISSSQQAERATQSQQTEHTESPERHIQEHVTLHVRYVEDVAHDEHSTPRSQYTEHVEFADPHMSNTESNNEFLADEQSSPNSQQTEHAETLELIEICIQEQVAGVLDESVAHAEQPIESNTRSNTEFHTDEQSSASSQYTEHATQSEHAEHAEQAEPTESNDLNIQEHVAHVEAVFPKQHIDPSADSTAEILVNEQPTLGTQQTEHLAQGEHIEHAELIEVYIQELVADVQDEENVAYAEHVEFAEHHIDQQSSLGSQQTEHAAQNEPVEHVEHTESIELYIQELVANLENEESVARAEHEDRREQNPGPHNEQVAPHVQYIDHATQYEHAQEQTASPAEHPEQQDRREQQSVRDECAEVMGQAGHTAQSVVGEGEGGGNVGSGSGSVVGSASQDSSVTLVADAPHVSRVAPLFLAALPSGYGPLPSRSAAPAVPAPGSDALPAAALEARLPAAHQAVHDSPVGRPGAGQPRGARAEETWSGGLSRPAASTASSAGPSRPAPRTARWPLLDSPESPSPPRPPLQPLPFFGLPAPGQQRVFELALLGDVRPQHLRACPAAGSAAGLLAAGTGVTGAGSIERRTVAEKMGQVDGWLAGAGAGGEEGRPRRFEVQETPTPGSAMIAGPGDDNDSSGSSDVRSLRTKLRELDEWFDSIAGSKEGEGEGEGKGKAVEERPAGMGLGMEEGEPSTWRGEIQQRADRIDSWVSQTDQAVGEGVDATDRLLELRSRLTDLDRYLRSQMTKISGKKVAEAESSTAAATREEATEDAAATAGEGVEEEEEVGEKAEDDGDKKPEEEAENKNKDDHRQA
ncbi:hypothetical protein OQA88_11282 [Cercophora sp. LCS_1]